MEFVGKDKDGKEITIKICTIRGHNIVQARIMGEYKLRLFGITIFRKEQTEYFAQKDLTSVKDWDEADFDRWAMETTESYIEYQQKEAEKQRIIDMVNCDC